MISTSSTQTSKPFGITDQMTSKNTQAVPVAYVCGTRKIAVTWISPVYNLLAQPAATGGKK